MGSAIEPNMSNRIENHMDVASENEAAMFIMQRLV